MKQTSQLPQASHQRLSAYFARAGLFCISALLAILVILQVLPDETRRAAFLDLASPVIDLLAGVCLLGAAAQTRRRSRRLAFAWGILALAVLFYAAGDAAWAVLEVVLHAVPFPSIADVLYLAFYAAALAGIVLLSRKPAGTAAVIKNALDVAVILAAAILGFWNLLIGPIIQSNRGLSPLDQAILAIYPVADLVMLGGLLLITYNNPTSSVPAGEPEQSPQVLQPAIPVFLLAAGMLIMIVTDCMYSSQTILGNYSSGSVLSIGWIVAFLLVAMAGTAQWIGMQPDNAISAYSPGPLFQRWVLRLKNYLPYAWLVGAFVLLIAAATTPLPMSFGSIAFGVSLILALMLVRQAITLSENHRLTTQLQAQAISLENANRDLNREMAERVRIQEKLAFDVLHDQMTGLANRRLFLDRLGQAIKRCKRHAGMCFGVLFMDLDQFKVVNDSLGHACGDQLLISLARRLEDNLRSGDTVARFGGDEFAILLDDIDTEDAAQKLAEKLQGVIAEPYRVQDRDVHITASIGIAAGASAYEHPEDLLRDVDLAMYQAKARGKARCVTFRDEMRDLAFSRLTLEDGLRNALKYHEFTLFYQPITSLESDEVVAVEALLRWSHPARGLLLPADFLIVAEESDLIVPIGEWVLEQACRQLKAWQDQYPNLEHLAVNVNLSNREFAQPDLAGKVARALQLSGLQGSSLRLEITERVLVENYPNSNDFIAALNEMGVKVEIDDFGTGYSALAYLQQFPINAIKIDKSFISDMRRNRRGLGLVRAIVSMARELGMDTIAEGIETGEQLSELKGLLCGFGQGYLLSQPLEPGSAGEILSRLNA